MNTSIVLEIVRSFVASIIGRPPDKYAEQIATAIAAKLEPMILEKLATEMREYEVFMASEMEFKLATVDLAAKAADVLRAFEPVIISSLPDILAGVAMEEMPAGWKPDPVPEDNGELKFSDPNPAWKPEPRDE